MMDSKPLIDEKHRGSTYDENEELKESHFSCGSPDSMGRFKTSPESQFKSLYSFQTFKWLIFQAQAQQITVEEL